MKRAADMAIGVLGLALFHVLRTVYYVRTVL